MFLTKIKQKFISDHLSKVQYTKNTIDIKIILKWSFVIPGELHGSICQRKRRKYFIKMRMTVEIVTKPSDFPELVDPIMIS